MNSVAASELIEDVACLMGWRADDLDEQQFIDIRNALSHALQTIWEDRSSWWPQTMTEVHMALEDYHVSGDSYVAGDVVYHPESDAYWQCIADTDTDPADYNTTTGEWEATADWYECATDTGDDAEEWDEETTYTAGECVWFDNTLYLALDAVPVLTSPALYPLYWQALVTFEARVLADGNGTKDASRPNIAAVRTIAKYQPSRVGDCQAYDFQEHGEQWDIFDLDQSTVWVDYRKLCPPLVGDDYDATAAYEAVTNYY